MTLKNKNYLFRWKEILIIAWPLVVANSFWNLQLTIDRLFLAEYSTESLAAATAVMGVFWTPMALLQQTSAYLMTFVAQYYGAKRYSMIGPAVWQSIYVSIFGGVLMLALIPASDAIFNFIEHPVSMRSLEIDYFNSIMTSGLPTALVAAASAYFTGLGRTRTIMVINLAGMLANVLFDYMLILGKFGMPELGISGAGYATALANVVAAILGLTLVFLDKTEHDYHFKSGFKFNFSLMRRFLKYGLPAGMQWALEGLAFTVFLIIVGRMINGAAALASSGIAVTIMMLSILPALGIAQAVSVLVGQHLGEEKPETAEKSTWAGFQVSLIYILLVGATLVLFPQFYLMWFKNEADLQLWQQVEFMTPYLLMYVAWFTCFDAMNMNFSFALKGAGDTRFVTSVALILPWPIMVLPTWLIHEQPGAIYYSWGFATIFGMVQAFVFYRRFMGGKWKLMSVIRDE
ncbi:MAG: MATE family efflux transporter [Leptospiraceae bacterium]|nr:MATE family efflux transporter [Leptospiraceae bacterium]